MNEQMEFDFGPEVCKCTDTTTFDELCPSCLTECLEFMNAQDELDYEDYT